MKIISLQTRELKKLFVLCGQLNLDSFVIKCRCIKYAKDVQLTLTHVQKLKRWLSPEAEHEVKTYFRNEKLCEEFLIFS